jgi:hypothetical protein
MGRPLVELLLRSPLVMFAPRSVALIWRGMGPKTAQNNYICSLLSYVCRRLTVIVIVVGCTHNPQNRVPRRASLLGAATSMPFGAHGKLCVQCALA